jgi:hypothetical protein
MLHASQKCCCTVSRMCFGLRGGHWRNFVSHTQSSLPPIFELSLVPEHTAYVRHGAFYCVHYLSSRFSAAYLVLPRLPAVPLHILYWAGETGEGVTWEGAHGSNKGRNCRRRRDQSICGGGGSRGSEWAAECTSQLEKRQSARVPRILREEPTWYCKHQSIIGGFTT